MAKEKEGRNNHRSNTPKVIFNNPKVISNETQGLVPVSLSHKEKIRKTCKKFEGYEIITYICIV